MVAGDGMMTQNGAGVNLLRTIANSDGRRRGAACCWADKVADASAGVGRGVVQDEAGWEGQCPII